MGTASVGAWRCNRARARRVIGSLCACLLACSVAACHHVPADQAVRTAINAAVSAARANHVRRVLAVTSDDFSGNGGELDRRGLRQLLALRALRGDRTGVLIGPVRVTRVGGRVLAKFNLVLTSAAAGNMLPNHAAVYALTTAWRREGGKWRCYNATWPDTGP